MIWVHTSTSFDITYVIRASIYVSMVAFWQSSFHHHLPPILAPSVCVFLFLRFIID